jgi:heptosyltransferase III
LTGLLCRFARCDCTIGFRTPGQHRQSLYDLTVAYSLARHVMDNIRAMANLFGPLAEYRPALRQDLPAADAALPFDRLVLLHTRPGGSRAQAKSWPDEHWVALGRSLIETGYTLGFTGSPDDASHVEHLIASIGATPQCCLSLCSKLDLVGLASVLRRARLCITVDTAIVHLASALDAPVIVLYGPTAREAWGPRSRNAVSIDSPHPAAGIMPAIPVSAVSAAAMMMLEPARKDVPQSMGAR